MKNPEHFYYTKEHEWAEFKDGKVIIGITEYAQSQLGDVIFLEFPEVGQEFSAGDVFGEVEAVKTVSELYSPVSGKIIELKSLKEYLQQYRDVVISYERLLNQLYNHKFLLIYLASVG